MRDVFRRGNLGSYRVQLKKFHTRPLFTKSGVYSCLAFFSLGIAGVAPTFPQSQEGAHLAQGEVVQKERANRDEKMFEPSRERCFWQEDVAQFLTLQENKKENKKVTFQKDTPCERESTTKNGATQKKQSIADTELGSIIRELTADYPIAVMTPMIAGYEREVAALLVGIAKKESNWGKRVPLDTAGLDCFNYWGYKGEGSRGVAMGHACFGSPEEAVMTVGNRLKQLVTLRKTSAPADMIIWKCGSSCKGHSDESVKKWISDVSLYYNQVAVK